MANRKTSTGFDLVVGSLLADGWERAKVPFPVSSKCAKCPNSQLEEWHLHRFVQAFGQLIEQNCKAWVCPNCLHEVLVEAHNPSAKKGKVKKPSLSKAKALQLSKFLNGLTPEQLKEFLG